MGLENSVGKDGTPDSQKRSLNMLWKKCYETWYSKAPGIEKIIKDKGAP